MTAEEPRTTASEPRPEAEGLDRELSLRRIVAIGLGLAAVTAVAFVLMWLLVRGLMEVEQERDPPPRPVPEANLPQRPPEPRLQEHPEADLGTLRGEEDAVLGSYGWVDREAGVARIPIERAMEILAERGLPMRGEAEEAAAEIFGDTVPAALEDPRGPGGGQR